MDARNRSQMPPTLHKAGIGRACSTLRTESRSGYETLKCVGPFSLLSVPGGSGKLRSLAFTAAPPPDRSEAEEAGTEERDGRRLGYRGGDFGDDDLAVAHLEIG